MYLPSKQEILLISAIKKSLHSPFCPGTKGHLGLKFTLRRLDSNSPRVFVDDILLLKTQINQLVKERSSLYLSHDI